VDEEPPKLENNYVILVNKRKSINCGSIFVKTRLINVDMQLELDEEDYSNHIS
jgi:hypothetical protein